VETGKFAGKSNFSVWFRDGFSNRFTIGELSANSRRITHQLLQKPGDRGLASGFAPNLFDEGRGRF
jgi:hypothetical protein